MADWKYFEHTPSLELVELIKRRNKDAFDAFYFRFFTDVTKTCEIICKNWKFGLDVAEKVSDQTFGRFWLYPQYDHSKSNASDPDKGITVYLLRIARNIFADLWKERKNDLKNPYDGTEEIVWGYPDQEEDDCGEVKEIQTYHDIVVTVLGKFSEKHKVIFYTYSAYEKKDFKLPRELLSDLRKYLGLSQSTIRTYKKEVHDKIEEYKKIYGIR